MGMIYVLSFSISRRPLIRSVPHEPLMTKIYSLNLDERINVWINNYLTNRRQVVAVNGAESSDAMVLSGVPHAGLCARPFIVSHLHR